MKLSSPAFSDGELIPSKYTCEGQDVSAPLEWEDVPEEAKSLAFIVEDPDAPSGTFVHWLLWSIPPDQQGLAEGVGVGGPKAGGGVQGKNDFGKTAYGGPCPPSGTHRYYFRLFALDIDPKLSPGASRRELDAATRGHVLAEAQLLGLYARKRRKTVE